MFWWLIVHGSYSSLGQDANFPLPKIGAKVAYGWQKQKRVKGIEIQLCNDCVFISNQLKTFNKTVVLVEVIKNKTP